jgi:hypothetical protein
MLASSSTSSADFRWRQSHAGQVADILAEGHTAIDVHSGQRLEGVVLRREFVPHILNAAVSSGSFYASALDVGGSLRKG